MATRKKIVEEPKFTGAVLSVRDQTLSRKVERALRSARGRGGLSAAATRRLLGGRVAPDALPKWLVLAAPDGIGTVAHLAAPQFVARGFDEDMFFEEPARRALLVDSEGRARQIGGPREASVAKLAPRQLTNVTAYEAGGLVLGDLAWMDKAPASVAEATMLLDEAARALGGALSPYTPEVVRAAQPAMPALEAPRPSSGGSAEKVAVESPPRRAPEHAWRTKARVEVNGGELGGSPVFAPDLDLVVAGGDVGGAVCVATRSKDGKSAWTTTLTTEGSIVGRAAIHRGVVLQATTDALFALDAKKGTPLWTTPLPRIVGSPLVIGELVFVGMGSGVVGLEVASGRVAWSFAVAKDKYERGVLGGIAYEDGALFFHAEGKLFAVDVASKKSRWSTEANGQATPSVDDRFVYAWSKAGLREKVVQKRFATQSRRERNFRYRKLVPNSIDVVKPTSSRASSASSSGPMMRRVSWFASSKIPCRVS